MNMLQVDSQNTNIKKHLEQGKSITALEALKLYGCFRLGARIHDLKRMFPDMNIKSELVNIGEKRVARYSLQSDN